MINLSVDKVVGNAFVALLEKTSERQIAMKKIYEYLDCISKKLDEKNIEYLNLCFQREYTDNFFKKYSSWFEIVTINEESYIVLSKDISHILLRNEFRILLSIEELKIYLEAEEKVLQ